MKIIKKTEHLLMLERQLLLGETEECNHAYPNTSPVLQHPQRWGEYLKECFKMSKSVQVVVLFRKEVIVRGYREGHYYPRICRFWQTALFEEDASLQEIDEHFKTEKHLRRFVFKRHMV